MPGDVPTAAKNAGEPCSEQSECGNPINISVGNKYQRELDFDSPASVLRLERTYNSVSSASDGFGVGWSHFYRRSIQIYSDTGTGPAKNSVVTLSRPDGKRLSFSQAGVSAPWVRETDVKGVLTENGLDGAGKQTGWRYVNEKDEIESYNAIGQLVGLSTVDGRSQTLTYSCQVASATCPVAVPANIAPLTDLLLEVSDSTGRRLSFVYDSFARVSTVITPTGNFSYAYTGAALSSRLVSVTYPDASSRSYLYGETGYVSPTPNAGVDTSRELTGIIDEKGNRYASWTYDADGKATSSEHAGGVDKVSMSYSSSDGSATVTDAMNTTRQYGFTTTFNASRNTGIGIQPCNGCFATLSYDANGNVASKDDVTNVRTCLSHDLSRNLETVRVEGLANSVSCASVTPDASALPAGSRKTSRQWHPNWRLPVKEAMPLRIVTSVYNGQTDTFTSAVASCAPNSATLPDGKPIAVLCKQVVQATTDANGGSGFAATINFAVAAQTSTFTYDSMGRLLIRIDPVGKTTTFAHYLPFVAADDPNFDKDALLLHGEGPNGSTTIVDSGPNSNTVLAGGNAQISTAQSKFGSSSFYLDGAGDYLYLPGLNSEFAFGDGDFTVEGWLRPNTLTAGPSVYDSRPYLVNGAYLNIGFDTSGQMGVYVNSTVVALTSSPISSGVWTHFAVSRSGTTSTLFINGTAGASWSDTTFYFNGADRPVMGVNGYLPSVGNYPGYIDEVRVSKGVARYTANFTPPTQAFLSPVAIPPYTLEHKTGDLQSATNAAGHVTQYTRYDQSGRVLQSVDPKGITTTISYTPRGWTGTVTQAVPSGPTRTTTYSYDAAGQLTQANLPDGTTLGYSYDAAHRLTGVTDARGNSVTYTLDNAGNRVSEQFKDPQGSLSRSISRVYDALNRVQQVTGAAQ